MATKGTEGKTQSFPSEGHKGGSKVSPIMTTAINTDRSYSVEETVPGAAHELTHWVPTKKKKRLMS